MDPAQDTHGCNRFLTCLGLYLTKCDINKFLMLILH